MLGSVLEGVGKPALLSRPFDTILENGFQYLPLIGAEFSSKN
jgi:hypothetical protein